MHHYTYMPEYSLGQHLFWRVQISDFLIKFEIVMLSTSIEKVFKHI